MNPVRFKAEGVVPPTCHGCGAPSVFVLVGILVEDPPAGPEPLPKEREWVLGCCGSCRVQFKTVTPLGPVTRDPVEVFRQGVELGDRVVGLVVKLIGAVKGGKK